MWQSIVLIVSILMFYGLSFLFVKKDRKFVFLLLSFIAISFYLLLQKEIGPDYPSYERIYNQIANAPWSKVFTIHLSVEPLYRLICKLFSVFGTNYHVFVRIYLLIALMISFFAFNRDCKNGLLNVIVFIAFSMKWTLAYRQFMAFAIILWAFKFVKNKKIIWYVLSIIIASMLHITACIAIVIYPIYNIEKAYKIYRWIIFVLILIVLTLNAQIIDIAKKIISFIDGRYQKYFTNEEFSLNMTLLMASFTFVLFLFLDRKNVQHNKAINMLLLCLLGFSCSAISNMTGRFMLYFFFLIGYSYDTLFDFESEDLNFEKKSKLNTNILITTTLWNRIFIFAIFIAGLVLFWWYTSLIDFSYVSLFELVN